MNKETSARLEETTKRLVDLLVARRYDDIEVLTQSKMLTAAQIKSAIDEYGRTLIAPPASAYERLDIVPVRERRPLEYSLRFRLHTKEEGISDLELQATLVDDPSGATRITLDGILVA